MWPFFERISSPSPTSMRGIGSAGGWCIAREETAPREGWRGRWVRLQASGVSTKNSASLTGFTSGFLVSCRSVSSRSSVPRARHTRCEHSRDRYALACARQEIRAIRATKNTIL
jgi:hypothetical protein